MALQKDGWFLRSEVIWCKPNALPESVRDRPTRAHETIFLLTKNEDYYYDFEAIREKGVNGQLRNKRSVWSIHTEPYNGAHFATFPPKLVEPCILAGSAEGDFVLDPFLGSGTTGLVAGLNRRSFVGIELKAEYVALARARLAKHAITFETVRATERSKRIVYATGA
jgi:site-specific DNA-methyltransferase (adenine-specific)